MYVTILRGYRGAHTTNMHYLPPGEYDLPDELAHYLIANGHATAQVAHEAEAIPSAVLTDDPPVTDITYVDLDDALDDDPASGESAYGYDAEETSEVGDAIDYDALTLDELRALVEERGLIDFVVATGTSGRVLKRDYLSVLQAQG